MAEQNTSEISKAETKKVQQEDSDDSFEYEYHKGLPEKEFEENLEYLKNHPLFLKEIPENIQDNPGVVALQNLIYNDEPIKIARHFNTKGGEFIKQGLNNYTMKEAMKCYDEGIAQDFTDGELRGKLHCNRAFLHLKNKNYGKALQDVKLCVASDPKNIKGYYRGATAYFALDKLKEALEYCDKGLEIDPESKEFIQLKDQIWASIKKKEEKVEKEKALEKTAFGKVIRYFREKGYVLGKRIHEIPDAYKLDPYLDEEKHLHFSVCVSYPEFSQMDFIKDAKDSDIIKDHLKEILKSGLPWDEKGHYNMKSIEVYLEMNTTAPLHSSDNHTNFQQAYLRISRKNTFEQVLKLNGYVMPHLIDLIIISRESDFYKKFKEDNEFIKAA
eukprot:CAMPEP_0176419550 /NCGR_PEP_ID=MMETSP0127-20121128/8111_1 /TAXON_ID=938130 /ORGANISM="Platyophrya macrostoma, Strain WH" /LENGTH=385 /DNA_ID=CAMNT_0017800043 /DNA_START=13 /DNA_END=1170 /DNA_ORIENTATION=-